jgi:hypothetical protein
MNGVYPSLLIAASLIDYAPLFEAQGLDSFALGLVPNFVPNKHQADFLPLHGPNGWTSARR